MMTQQIRCQVADITPLAESIFRIRLLPEKNVPFKAGQYLQVVLSDNDKRPFSIASTSDESKWIELHIGASDYNAYAISVVELMKTHNDVMVEIPKGEAYFREESERPLLLVAGGTGYSYIRAILVRALALNSARQIHVFWGGRTPDQLYDLPFLFATAQHHPNVNIVATVEQPTRDWQGRTGLLLDVVLQDLPDMSAFDIYLCGRFEMAKVAFDRFTQAANAEASHIFGDALTY